MRKIGAYLSGMMWSLVFLPALLIFLCLAVACIAGLWFSIVNRSLHDLYTTLCIGGFAAYVGVWLVGSWHGILEAKQTAQVPVVPPVTVNTLPADEVLLRGSAEPPIAQGEVLVRPATAQQTPETELVRPI